MKSWRHGKYRPWWAPPHLTGKACCPALLRVKFLAVEPCERSASPFGRGQWVLPLSCKFELCHAKTFALMDFEQRGLVGIGEGVQWVSCPFCWDKRRGGFIEGARNGDTISRRCQSVESYVVVHPTDMLEQFAPVFEIWFNIEHAAWLRFRCHTVSLHWSAPSIESHMCILQGQACGGNQSVQWGNTGEANLTKVDLRIILQLGAEGFTQHAWSEYHRAMVTTVGTPIDIHRCFA